MNVGFAGTPAFAACLLQALVEAEIPVTLALTQPDRPRGRGQKLTPSPVKAFARQHAIPVHDPSSLATVEARALLLAHDLDVLVVAAYGLMLPAPILKWPMHGCINVHASLLPRWRGAAPIQRALLAGDEETGVTLMQMDEGLDTGPMLDVVRFPIDERETAATLEQKLATAAASVLLSYLRDLARGIPPAGTPQPAAGATYASKIDKREAEIDWGAAAVTIDRTVRAFDPVPGAATSWAGERVKVWRAHPASATIRAAAPGTVVAVDERAITVACGDGALVVEELQPAGGRRMGAAVFAAGRRLTLGARFGTTPDGG
jgi:methionyl-tRNA formyltransferase